jgi:hypothetical protein
LSAPFGDPPDDSSPSEALSPNGIHSPMESFSHYRGADWTPERLAFHQNLETFADRVGLIVGLQANGKISQDAAYDEIKALWSSLRSSHSSLLK